MANILERGPDYQGFVRISFNVYWIVMFQLGEQNYNTFNYIVLSMRIVGLGMRSHESQNTESFIRATITAASNHQSNTDNNI